jgi:hypothetical protein
MESVAALQQSAGMREKIYTNHCPGICLIILLRPSLRRPRAGLAARGESAGLIQAQHENGPHSAGRLSLWLGD